LVKRTVWAVVVEVRHVLGQHRHKMAAAKDQHPVQQFTAGSSNPSFGNRVVPRRPLRLIASLRSEL
jgi:hypothetical protein